MKKLMTICAVVTVILAVNGVAQAIPATGLITFEEFLDGDSSQFDTWDVVTTQYQSMYGITFSGINGGDGPFIFDNVLPGSYIPASPTRILGNKGGSATLGTMQIDFDVPVSNVTGYLNVASEYEDPQASEASVTVKAYDSTGGLLDSATAMHNYGVSNTMFDLWGNQDIAYVTFTHSEGPTNYYWACDDIGYQVIPEPATMSLLVLGGLALIRRRRK